MGLFGSLDVESAEENPFQIPDGVYEAVVFDSKIQPYKQPTKQGATEAWLIQYKIETGPHTGKMQSEFKGLPGPTTKDSDKSSMLSWLKQRALSLGVPEQRINSFKNEDIIGTYVYITVKTKGEYTNVTKVEINDDQVDNIADNANPFA